MGKEYWDNMADTVEHVSVSVSQINEFDAEHMPKEGCNRKWGFQKIDKRIKPQNIYAARGDEIHKKLEAAQLLNVWPDAHDPHQRLVQKMMEHALPMTQGMSGVEYKFDEHNIYIGPARLNGRIDRLDILPSVYDPILITDWKSTGSPKFAKTESSLGKDTQANLYTYVVLKKFVYPMPRDRAVTRWVYGDVNNDRVWPVETTISLTQAEEFVEKRTLPVVEKMVQLRRTPGLKAMDLEPNFKACGAFKGCPFRQLCGLRPVEWLGAVMSSGTLLSQLQGELGLAPVAQAPAPPQAPAPAWPGQAPAVQPPPAFPGFPPAAAQTPAAPAVAFPGFPPVNPAPPAAAPRPAAPALPLPQAPAPAASGSATNEGLILSALIAAAGAQAVSPQSIPAFAGLAKQYAQALK